MILSVYKCYFGPIAKLIGADKDGYIMCDFQVRYQISSKNKQTNK